MIGKTLSHYKVIEKIGQGGMGEVYLAQDTTLERRVALKFLPEELQEDPTARKRFLREAKSAAALDHPYICHIHEVGEVEGKSFIAMEYVQGATLTEKLAEGPLPLKDALRKAREIAEALEAAHKQNIVHRDLKPSNIMLTPEGHVKVMDFGLAKRVTPTEGQEQEITTVLTRAGSTLGTVPYMSPEQVRGPEVDTRSDIFSFGVILYEMLTGVHPFKKGGHIETATAILSETVSPLTLYSEDIPLLLQHTVRKMLAKEPDKRYQLIHEVCTDLGDFIDDIRESPSETGDALSKPSTAGTIRTSEPTAKRSWQRLLWWGGVALIGVTAAVAVWNLRPQRPPTPQPIRRFAISPLPTQQLGGGGGGNYLTLSPDGRYLVYVVLDAASTQLYLHPMDRFKATPLPGTEGAKHPFFSPDGQWVTFFSGGKLKKASLVGVSPLTISEVGTTHRGATWRSDDTIIFGTFKSGLMQVSASGGTAQAITTLEEGEVGHRWPEMLPDGQALLFTVVGEPGTLENARIAFLSLETHERRILLDEESYNARYAPTGHIIYMKAATLMAVPFDLRQLKVTGPAVPILSNVRARRAGGADFSFSNDGALVYMRPPFEENTLVWVDREGRATPVTETKRAFEEPHFSPDGQYLSVTVTDADGPNVWVYDITRGILSPTTFESENDRAIWTPDGKRLTFASNRTGQGKIYWMPADGSGEAEPLIATPLFNPIPSSWSPDHVLVYSEGPANESDLWVLLLEGERTPQPFLATQFNERQPMFSPDGRWISFTSDRSGREEVYVKPYAVEGGIVAISTDGGTAPRWARDGKELFYRNGDKMMVVSVETEPTFQAETPRLLFEEAYDYYSLALTFNYDISPDGQRFVMVEASEQPARTQIHVVLNWFEELKRLVPTGQ